MTALIATAGTRADPRGVHDSATSLLRRARVLRAHAQRANPLLSGAYLRRAAELSLEAWVRAIDSAPIKIDDFIVVAAWHGISVSGSPCLGRSLSLAKRTH